MTDENNTEKKPRRMTPQGFLSKATKTNLSAAGFLAQYREYMLTGEIAYSLKEIVAKVDAGVLYPTPAVAEIATATMNHILAASIIKGKKSIERQLAPKEEKEPKAPREPKKPANWIASVYDASGIICTRTNAEGEEEEMVKGFEVSGDADKYTVRRLALDCGPGCYAIVTHTHSANVQTILQRDDALAIFYRKGRGPTMKVSSKTTSKLSFGATCHESRASFSRG